MYKETDYTKLREIEKKKRQDDENLKPKQPECTRCRRKGHYASSCTQPRKPTDKE